MARIFSVPGSGAILIIPSSSVTTNVLTNPTGLSSSGVIALVGEADGGPQWSEESKLSSNTFSASDMKAVKAKYGSGRLVDAFAVAVSPSSSAAIQGTFNRILMVKTNKSSKASINTLDGHGKIEAKLASAKGNDITEKITVSQAETAPTTGQFSYVPSASSSTLSARINGSAVANIAISANETPAQVAAAIDATGSLLAQGGKDLVITSGLSAADDIKVEVSGQNVDITLGAGSVFGNAIAAGDVVRIPAGSVIEGSLSANVGWYLVSAVVNTVALAKISAKKITAGAPANVAFVSLSATPAADILAFGSMSIKNISGSNRDVLADLVGINASASATQSYLTFSLAASEMFTNQPKVGDFAFIPSSSAFAGVGSANKGWFQVVEVQNNSVSAYAKLERLSNGNPISVTSTAIGAGDIVVIKPQIAGYSKSMELFDGAGTVNVNTVIKQLAVDAAASWLNTLIISAAELKMKLAFNQSSSAINESFVYGGNVIFKMGYAGTSASMSIIRSGSQVLLQTSVVGGPGSNLNIDISKIPSLNDLVIMLNSLPGYSAEVLNNAEGVKSPLVLDEVVSVGICSASAKPGRIKRDSDDMTAGTNNINASSQLVNYTLNVPAGLPEAEGTLFLAGGAKGGSTAADVLNAIDALAATRVNFVVPVFSQDAATDLAAGETESSSTYDIDAINAAVKNHCLLMSTEKTKRHRIAFVSKKAAIADQKSAAQNLSHFRVAFLFQDMIDLAADGTLKQLQPCFNAVKAAALQAAGFYKAIYNKPVNMSGIVNPAGFDDQSESNCEDAILAGMIPVQVASDGSYLYLTDQTTYGYDNNFVYNSAQAVYVADIIAVSIAEAVQRAFVGASTADVTPSSVTTFIRGKIAEYKNNKLVAGTSVYPEGWKSINVSISEDVLYIDMNVIEGTSIRFAPITLNISGVQSSANA